MAKGRRDARHYPDATAATADAPGPDDMKTDADGKVTFTIMGPEDDGDTNAVSRDDTVTFQGDVDGDTDRTDDPVVADNENCQSLWSNGGAQLRCGGQGHSKDRCWLCHHRR